MGHAGWETAGLSIRTFMYFHGIEALPGAGRGFYDVSCTNAMATLGKDYS